jgi:RNA 3'-terminal phosphate cyclase
MHLRERTAHFLESAGGGLPVPRLAKLGGVVMAVGLLADVTVHAFVQHVHDALETGFPIDEHLAHLVVVLGMVLVLAGIVADGVRTQRRHVRQEGIRGNAIW